VASIVGNTANENSLGIFLLNSDNSSIVQNTLDENEIGIFAQGISGENIIELNTANNNSISGILFELATRRNRISENTATNNSDTGLASYGDNELLNNYAVFNGRNEVHW
jgi:parallel beta-helix repeat protein